jgi:hypothetical protein
MSEGLTAGRIEWLREVLPELLDKQYDHSRFNHEEAINALCDMALSALRPEGVWVPVSERLTTPTLWTMLPELPGKPDAG